MHQFLDYSQIVGNTCINKTFLYSLRTGIKTMTIVSPLKKNADFYNILYRFGGIKELSGECKGKMLWRRKPHRKPGVAAALLRLQVDGFHRKALGCSVKP